MGGVSVTWVTAVLALGSSTSPALLWHGGRRWRHHVRRPVRVLAAVWVLRRGRWLCLLGWHIRRPCAHMRWWGRIGLLGLHEVRVALGVRSVPLHSGLLRVRPRFARCGWRLPPLALWRRHSPRVHLLPTSRVHLVGWVWRAPGGRVRFRGASLWRWGSPLRGWSGVRRCLARRGLWAWWIGPALVAACCCRRCCCLRWWRGSRCCCRGTVLVQGLRSAGGSSTHLR